MILLQIFIGIVTGFIYKARKYVLTNSFDYKIWWEENRWRLLWSSIFGLLIFGVLTLSPTIIPALFKMMGISLDFEIAAVPLLIGLTILNIAYKPVIPETEELK